MIVSENTVPELSAFRKLMHDTDRLLNREAKADEAYFCGRAAQRLEEDVYNALNECAKGTEFEKTIQLVSGAHFPDIQIHNFYGVEVKSTIKNHWTSTGSSILESTRNVDIRRIFMTFGKLGRPVEFRSRPYEECLSDIAVTHYPRYRIDMELGKGQTIFDKIGISYDELRKLRNPVEPVSKYYRKNLNPGESLWWAPDAPPEEQSVPATIRIFSALPEEDREELQARLYALFPHILGKSPDKYNKPALFLLTHYGIINPSFRDMFSAGGKRELPAKGGVLVRMPAIFGRIEKYKGLISEIIKETSPRILSEGWGEPVKEQRISQWCKICARQYADKNCGYTVAYDVLSRIFSLHERAGENHRFVASPR